MKAISRGLLRGAVLGLSVSTAAAIALPAAQASSTSEATDSPQVIHCTTQAIYQVENTGTSLLATWFLPARAQGGHTLSITDHGQVSQLTASVGGSVEADASAIVASAKASINASVAFTLSASVSYGDSWTVPSSWAWGDLHAGATSQNFNWQYGTIQSNCVFAAARQRFRQRPVPHSVVLGH